MYVLMKSHHSISKVAFATNFVNFYFSYFTMVEDNNPWSVNKLEEFLQYCCPECEDTHKSKESFVLHAFERHPRAKDVLELRLDSDTVTVVSKNHLEQGTSFKLQKVAFEDMVIVNNAPEKNVEKDTFYQPQGILIKNIDGNCSTMFEEQDSHNNTDQIICEMTEETSNQDSIVELKKHEKLKIDYDLFDNPFLDKRNAKDNMSGVGTMQTYKCDICGQIFNKSSKLSKHIFTIHDAGEEHQCEYCHKIFHVKGVLSKHIINDHSETMAKPYPCSICNQSFVSSDRLRFHTRKYHDSSMKCEHCDKTFGKLSDKKRHISNVHDIDKPPKSHKCCECSKMFSTNHDLNKHTKYVHQGIRVHHQCNLCNKSYVSSRALKNHIKYFHEQQQRNIQTVNCSYCNKAFRPDNLKKHIMCVHQGIRPRLKCEFVNCGKIYESHRGLASHVKRFHQGIKEEKIHKCNWCNKYFTRYSTVKKHIAEIHLTSSVPSSRKQKTIIHPSYQN